MLFKEIETQHGSLYWANFFLRLGRFFGEKIINNEALHHIVIKTHYTDFIPQIISLGFADYVYSNMDDDYGDENIKEKLHPNTTIYYRAAPEIPEEPYIYISSDNNGFPIIKDMKKNPTSITVGIGWEKKIRIANEQIIYKKSRALKNKNLTNLKKHYSAERLEQLARLNHYRILIIGNETRITKESEATIQGLPFYNWLLMRPFLHQQSYYLTNVYSSKYKEALENLPSNTLVIYASLDAYYNFNEEELLEDFPSIILYTPFENAPIEIEALTTIVENLENYDASELIENELEKNLPKGVEIATWTII